MESSPFNYTVLSPAFDAKNESELADIHIELKCMSLNYGIESGSKFLYEIPCYLLCTMKEQMK